MGWCFYSHLVLRCTNRHPIKAFFSCLCLWGGAFSRILYFDVQTGTQSNHFLVVYVYGVVFFFSHLVLRCTNRHQTKPILICLCSRDGAFTRILYFGAQTGTKTSLFLVVYNYGVAFTRILYFDVQTGAKSKLFLVVYVYEVVLFLASCTLVYNHAPKQAYFCCLCLWDGAFSRILHFGVQTSTKTNLF